MDSSVPSRSKPIIRYATRDDVYKIYGDRHFRSMKAIAAELDGEVIGLGGYYYTRSFLVFAFANISDKLKAHPVTLYKAGLKINEMFQKAKLYKVTAIADKDKEASNRFLDHLGYTLVGTSHEGDIYEWTPQRPLT